MRRSTACRHRRHTALPPKPAKPPVVTIRKPANRHTVTIRKPRPTVLPSCRHRSQARPIVPSVLSSQVLQTCDTPFRPVTFHPYLNRHATPRGPLTT